MLLKSCVGLSPQVAELMLQPSKIPSARPLALLQRCVWVLGRDQHQPGVWRSSSVIHWTTATRQSLSSEYSVPFPVSKWPRRVLDTLRSPLAGPSESGEHLQYALPLGQDDLVRDLVRSVFPSPLAPRTSQFYAAISRLVCTFRSQRSVCLHRGVAASAEICMSVLTLTRRNLGPSPSEVLSARHSASSQRCVWTATSGQY